MSRVFLTSDPHLGHEKVARLRGYEHVHTHDRELLDLWRAVLRPDDVLWVLGDLSAGGRRATEHALDLLTGVPARKRLVSGNHDPVHPMNRDAWRWMGRFMDVFEFVAPFARTRLDGVTVALSHFPYERDRGEPRYVPWRLRDEGLPLVHGHTHGTERLTVTTVSPLRVEVHVGVDAWTGTPVPAQTVADLVRRVSTPDPAGPLSRRTHPDR